MIVENKFLYTRVVESNGNASRELTFAGAVLTVIVLTALIVAVALIAFSLMTQFGITG